MAGPFDWRLDDIERKANAAAPAHAVDSLRSDVGSLESTVRELRSECDGLRASIQELQMRLESLETNENA